MDLLPVSGLFTGIVEFLYSVTFVIHFYKAIFSRKRRMTQQELETYLWNAATSLRGIIVYAGMAINYFLSFQYELASLINEYTHLQTP
jgi:hypothetical protein